jgi:O-antigen/teichoic acid export membrane protein
MFNVLRSWASRMGVFGGISRANVGGTATTVTVQLTLGFLQKLGAGGLIIGQAVGQAAHFVILLREVARGIFASIGRSPSFSRVLSLLGRYRRFPIYDCGASLLNACSRELPVLMLGAFFSATIVGYYSMGRRTLAMPLQVFGNSIAQVFFPKAKQQLDKGKLDKLASSVVWKLSVVGMTPMLLITVAAPEIITIVLGKTWIPSGIYFQWISIWLLSVFITAPLVQLFSVLERQKERLVYQSVQMAGRAVSLGYGGLQGDPVLAVALFCLSSAAVHYANCVWILHRTGVRPLSTAGILLGEFAKAIPFIAIVWFIKWYWGGEWLVIAAFTIAGFCFMGLRFRDLFSRT